MLVLCITCFQLKEARQRWTTQVVDFLEHDWIQDLSRAESELNENATETEVPGIIRSTSAIGLLMVRAIG